MKNKFILLLTFVFIISGKIYCSDWFSPAIKFGMNFNRSQYSKEHVPEKYFYPPGFNIGISNRIKLNQMFYISNDLYYKYKKSKMHFYFPGGEKYIMFGTDYIRLSALLGMKHLKYVDILMGFDFGKIIQADFVVSNKNNLSSYDKFKFEITNKVPSFDPSFCLGVRERFNLVKLKFIAEILYSIGLRKYKYVSPAVRINDKFRNHSINIIFGVQLLNSI